MDKPTEYLGCFIWEDPGNGFLITNSDGKVIHTEIDFLSAHRWIRDNFSLGKREEPLWKKILFGGEGFN